MENVQAPRHAGVVPAVLVRLMQGPFATTVGAVEPGELLDWQRPQPLSEVDGNNVAFAVLNRLRATRRLDVAATYPCIGLPPGWESLLDAKQAEGVRAAAAATDGNTSRLSLEQWTRHTKLGLKRLIRVLGLLEAAVWTGHSAGHVVSVPGAVQDFHELEPDTPSMSAQDIERAATLPWVAKVRHDDLRIRLPRAAATNAAAWLKAEAAAASPSRAACRAAHAILKLHSLTFAQEVEDVARAAARARNPRGAGGARVDQWVAVFQTRYLSSEGTGRTLTEAGSVFGLTRERIRQICEGLLEQIRCGSIALPATMRVLDVAARAVPSTVKELNEQLAPYLGEGAGIEAALNFAGEMGVERVPVEVVQTPVRLDGTRVRVVSVDHADGPQWTTLALRSAKRGVTFMGCSNLHRVAGDLALDAGLAPGRDALCALLESVPGFRWLDEEGGWFSLGNGGTDSDAANRVRKIMAVAHEPVSVDTIAAALITDDMWLSRVRGRDQSVPAVHILRDVMQGWTWLDRKQHNRFHPREPVPLDVLTDAERHAVRIIEDNGGIATRQQLAEAITAAQGITGIAVSFMLGGSPIFQKQEFGLYGLTGRRVDDAALARARTRLRMQQPMVSEADAKDWSKGFRLLITEASLRHEQYSVLVCFIHRFPPGELALVGRSETLWVGASGVLRRLKGVYPQSKPGDAYWVGVGQDGITLTLEPDWASHTAAAPSDASRPTPDAVGMGDGRQPSLDT